MKKILILAVMALSLASCYKVGDFVYIHRENDTVLGYVVSTSDQLIVAKLCDGTTLVSGSRGYFAPAGDGVTC